MSLKIMHMCLSRGWGGLEMYAARIIPELRRQGVETYGMALAESRVAHSMQAAGAEVTAVTGLGQALRRLPSLLSYLDKYAIDVLHCHKSSDLRLAALLAKFRPALRLFFTEHMGVTRPKKGLYHCLAYSQVSRVFSISEATYRRNLDALPVPAERIHHLGLGVDMAPYEGLAQSRQELGLPDDGCVIALPGRITPGKGHDIWLEALAQLERDSPWQAVMIGGLSADEGSDEAFVEQLKRRIAELELDERVTFMGFRSDLPELLKAVDIVCVPSHNEAFGLTVIEAMAAGAAVVGADSGAIPELITRDRGRLAAPDSSSVWTAALTELLNDAALRQGLGSHASRWAHEHMTLPAHVERLRKEYAKCF